MKDRLQLENHRLRTLLYKAGICSECEQELFHWVDEPFGSCDCFQGAEDYSGSSTIQKLRMKNKELLEHKQEIEDSFKFIMDEKPNDEVHCTCVPFLKTKIKELEADCEIYLSQNRFLQERLEEEKQKNEELKRELLALKPQNVWLEADRDRLASNCFVSSRKIANKNEIIGALRGMLDAQEKFLSEEIKGWENKWKCAVELAAIAENKLDTIRKSL